MAKFNKKNITESAKSVGRFVKKNPLYPISTASLAISGANYATNLKRKEAETEYHKEQLGAMKDLTHALTGVDKTLKKTVAGSDGEKDKGKSIFTIAKRKVFTENNNMIKFRRKDFSIVSDTLAGAKAGAFIGTLGSAFTPKSIGIDKKVDSSKTIKFKSGYNSLDKFKQSSLVVGATTIVGAALGALVGVVKAADRAISRSNVDNRLMQTIVDNLKKLSFKEGTDFTRDPKTADRLRTKVGIVVTKSSGELRILINVFSDNKLRDLTSEVTRTLPNTSVITKTASNKYNEISVSTISDGSADAGLVTGVCELYIRSGYPVYLVEVG